MTGAALVHYFLFFRRRTISPATVNTTRQMPIIILAFMFVFLLFLSEGEERHYASSQERNTGKSTPQRIFVVSPVLGISGGGAIVTV